MYLRFLSLATVAAILSFASGATNSTPQALNPLLTNSTSNAGGPVLYYNGSGPVPPYNATSPILQPLPSLKY